MAIRKRSIDIQSAPGSRYRGLQAICEDVLVHTDPDAGRRREWIAWQFLYLIWWESGRARHRRQLGDGPARGLIQMEPATLWDLLDRFVLPKPNRVALLADSAGVSVDDMGFLLGTFREANKLWDDDRQTWVGRNSWPVDGDARQVEEWLTLVDSFAITAMRLYFFQFATHHFPPQSSADLPADPREARFKGEFSEGWAQWWKRVFHGGPAERERLKREFEVRAAELDGISRDGNGGSPPPPGGTDDDPAPPRGRDGEGGGGCFLATAVFGPGTEEVAGFRRFRDRVLLPSMPGRILVAIYYRLSPPLAERIAERPRLQQVVRRFLSALLRRLPEGRGRL